MRGRTAVALLGAVAVALGVGKAGAQPGDQIMLNMSWASSDTGSLPPLIANFERVYPNITVNVTYDCLIGGAEQVELAAGNGPDLVCDFPGSGQSPSLSDLAKAGDLAPLVEEPWIKRSMPLVTSMSKVGKALYGFEKGVTPYGVYTNDALFLKLGLKVPQTFPQLLSLCQKARSDGAWAFILAAGSGVQVSWLISALAVPTVYASDPNLTRQLEAGTATFEGTPGWHTAMEEFIEMNEAGCFAPGSLGSTAAAASFAQGQGLMFGTTSSFGATIDQAQPQFTYSFHSFPGGETANSTTTFLNLSPTFGVNAHSSPQNQAAAHEFIDFMARPKQNALFERLSGGFTQYEFLKGQIPADMVGFGPILSRREWVLNPAQTWWNPSVDTILQQDGIGLVTGQVTVDDVLNAMDAAWKQGRS